MGKFKWAGEEQLLKFMTQEQIDELHRREDNGYYYEHPELVKGGGSDIPPGCRACGGNYPECTDSCKLFDD